MAASKRKKQGGGKPGAAQAPAGAPTGDAPAARAGVAPGAGAGAATDERSPQDIILENLPVIVVVLLVAMGLTALAVHRGNTQRAVSDTAWTALGEVKANSDSTPEDFQKLFREHEQTSAAPYIQLAWASKLYATGEKEKVEQARDLLKQLLQRNGDLPLIRDAVPGQLEKIEAELSDASIPWAAAAAQATREPEAGEDEHDHEGHDHGDEAAPDQPAGEAASDQPAGEAAPEEPTGEAAPDQPAEGGQQ